MRRSRHGLPKHFMQAIYTKHVVSLTVTGCWPWGESGFLSNEPDAIKDNSCTPWQQWYLCADLKTAVWLARAGGAPMKCCTCSHRSAGHMVRVWAATLTGKPCDFYFAMCLKCWQQRHVRPAIAEAVQLVRTLAFLVN